MNRTAARFDPNAISIKGWLTVVGQLLLLLVLIKQFNLESEAFFRLSLLTVGGFAIHYFLDLRYRLPFFVLLSLAGIGMVLGAVQGAWVVGIGLSLIGIAHLPVGFWTRAGLLLAIGGALSVPRWGLGSVPWSAAIWPILGSMFVFRMIVYMYDRKHSKEPTNWWRTLGYFFLLPNVCFPLFPVVDYRKFSRNYYDEERHKIYQVGVEWMWRGLLQLVLYRLVYGRLTVDAATVSNLGELLVYMLSTYMLYVRISGHFHLVIGMLHLFGFNLPETHHRYFLASSFTDFWRRINIYWKDFMLKVFYYPAYFKVRKLGDTTALILATAFTFVMTWLLHLVQWFWIRGSVLVETNDIIFWTIFGLLVTVNSIYETRRPRARALNPTRTLRESTGLVFRTLGTFTVICALWSFWTAESVTDWLLMMQTALVLPEWTAAQFLTLGVALVLSLGLIIVAVWKATSSSDRSTAIRVPVAAVYATTIALCVLPLPMVAAATGHGTFVGSLASGRLNQRDAEQFQRGYYENLLDVGRFNDELQKVYQAMPTDFVRSLSALGLARNTNDAQGYELVPFKEGRFVGRVVRTNRWGMRDRDYEPARTPGTYRIALLGPSTAMASGVDEQEGFEALLEERLNHEPGGRYEVLNFGVAGYSPLQMLFQLDRKVARFQPDMAIFLGHVSDLESTARYWTRLIQKGTMPDDPYFRELVRRTGMQRDSGPNEARRRLRPYRDELLRYVYSTFVSECRRRQIAPVFVYMQVVTEPEEPWRAADRARILELAREAQFPVLDLTGAYQGYTARQLWIAENDGHPNALGNRLLADRLYTLLTETRSIAARLRSTD